MAHPNRVLANLPQNPPIDFRTFRVSDMATAERFADEQRGAGFRVRVTRFKIGPKKAPIKMIKVAWFSAPKATA